LSLGANLRLAQSFPEGLKTHLKNCTSGSLPSQGKFRKKTLKGILPFLLNLGQLCFDIHVKDNHHKYSL
jgi:hypothetical protein